MEVKSCDSCTHFVQHLIERRGKIVIVNCGHCELNPSVKKVCKSFEEKQAEVEIAKKNKSIAVLLDSISEKYDMLIRLLEKPVNPDL